MSHSLAEMAERILADVFRSSLSGASQESVKAKRGRMAKPVLAPNGEDMESRLRSIRRYVTPTEFAGLKHIHVETVYRRIRAGMPADRDLNGRNLMIYPPQVAEWERKCRELRDHSIEAKLAFDKNGSSQKDSASGKNKESKK